MAGQMPVKNKRIPAGEGATASPYPAVILWHATLFNLHPMKWSKAQWRSVALSLASARPRENLTVRTVANGFRERMDARRGAPEKFTAAQAAQMVAGAESMRKKLAESLGRKVTWIEFFTVYRKDSKHPNQKRTDAARRTQAKKDANWLRNLRKKIGQ